MNNSSNDAMLDSTESMMTLLPEVLAEECKELE